jgi:2-methylisocitrate lyase-like PEP mutase family enzyme
MSDNSRILRALGFEAIAMSSAGMAYALGKPNGAVSREATLGHCRDVAASTPPPVSADLGNGFGDTPEEIYQIILAAAETGLAGCSIEDFDSIRVIVSAVSKPFSVMMMEPGLPYGVNELSEIGVKHISVGSAFAQLAYGSLIGAAQEIAQQGSFQFIKKAIDYKELETFFA